MAVIGVFQFANLLVNHAELNGRSILTNGLEEVRKYNPATGNWLPCVLRPFRQNIALAAGGAGNLNGEYIYRVVPYNVNEDEEGEAFPDAEVIAAYEINVVNQSVNVNLAALVPDSPETTAVRIYRTVGAGQYPALALVATVPLPAGVFNDNVDDDDLNFENEGLDIFTRVPVPKPFIVQHRERLFMIGDIPYAAGQAAVVNGNALITPAAGAVWGFHLIGKEFHAQGDGRAYLIEGFDPATGQLELADNYDGATRTTNYRICGDADQIIWTEPSHETQWAGANIRPIGGKENDKPTGLFSDSSSLIVPKSRKIYRLYYTTRPNLPPAGSSRVSVITVQHGGIGHRVWKMINGLPTGASKHGIIQLDGRGATLVSRDAQDWWLENLALNANGEQQFSFGLPLIEQEQYLLFFKSTEAEVGCDKALVWHYANRTQQQPFGKFTYHTFLTEFTSGEVVKDTNGRDIIVLGDRFGYVWQYPFGDIDGAPAGVTLQGTVDDYQGPSGSPDFCSILDLDAIWPTTGLGLAGVPVFIFEGTGKGQVGIIAANTVNVLVLEDCFKIALDSTSRYRLGPIFFQYRTGWLDFGTLKHTKYTPEVHLAFEKQVASDVEVNLFTNFSQTEIDTVDPKTLVDAGLIDLTVDISRHMMHPGGVQFQHLAIEFKDDKPANPISIYDISYAARRQD